MALLGVLAMASSAAARDHGSSSGLTVVGYTSDRGLRAALDASGAQLVRKVPALKVAEIRSPAALRALNRLDSIRYASVPLERHSLVEPGLTTAPAGAAYEWQYGASRENLVPAGVLRAATGVTVAVVDTGADVTAPDIGAKSPNTWSVLNNSTDVTDTHGHGTFVSSLAAGSVTNGEGIAGFGGDAKLIVVQAGRPDGTFTDLDEAAGITYAVDHGAKIINLSFGGTGSSPTEQAAIDYAVRHGVLLVAAAGNDGDGANQPLYPAALLQPLGSNGQGGAGLAVGATASDGSRASFSNFGSYVSLAAPGERVLGAVSSNASPSYWRPFALPGSSSGLYGYGSGTSFASPEVAGAAALVWAAKPQLTAQEVAQVLKQSATGNGAWNPQTGYGAIDVSAAVAEAQGLVGGAAPVNAAVPVNAKLTLRASAAKGRNRHAVRIWVSLEADNFTMSAARRPVALEALGGSTWHRIARATTTRAGLAAFTVKLRRGTYKLRATYAGSGDLGAAASAPLSISVR